MTLTQNITLDVARETALHIAGKQYDENSRFLLVTIKEAGEEKSIPAGSSITLNARRPDGSAQSFAGSVQDGKAFVEIDQWVLEQYGTVYCSVSVVDSSASKLTTLSFRLLVERAEGSGFVLVYVAPSSLAAGTYYITMAGVNYSFTTTEAVPAGGKIYFSSNGTTGKTTANGATIETLTLTAGSTGTELQGSDVVNFLVQMQANVAAIDAELDSKADKSAIEKNLTAGTSLATIDPNSYTPNTSPYLYRQSPSGKRCEMDIIGGTVGWNQLVNLADGSTTSQGVTITKSNGRYTATNTATSTGNYNLAAGLPITKDHIYIMSASGQEYPVSSSSGTSLQLYGADVINIQISENGTSNTKMGKADATGSATLRNRFISGNTYNYDFYPQVIDLTTLLGSTIADYAYSLEQATSGSGIAWLKSFGFLTKSYYPYSEPTLESVQAMARVARGINQWDEEWELGGINSTTGQPFDASTVIRTKNYSKIIGGATYYFKSSANAYIFFYDGNESYLSNVLQTANTSFTAPTNANFLKFQVISAYGTTYKNDICINLSNPTINGTYYPHESHTYPLGNTTLRGIPKLDSNNNIYYDGDKYKADGTVTRRYGVVDLGSLTWEMTTAGSNSVFRAILPTTQASTTNAKESSGFYTFTSTVSAASLTDGQAILSSTYWSSTKRLVMKNSAYASAEAFKAAMSGANLVYELATPTTESTDPFTPIQHTGSTEEFTTSNDVPVGVEGKYYDDLTLPELPTANGTYTLKCTVTDGTGIVSWVSE